jgi:hypothetical protein
MLKRGGILSTIDSHPPLRMIQAISIAKTRTRTRTRPMVMPVIIVTPSFVLLMHFRFGKGLAAFCIWRTAPKRCDTGVQPFCFVCPSMFAYLTGQKLLVD